MKRARTILIVPALLLTLVLLNIKGMTKVQKEIWRNVSVSSVHQVSNLGRLRSIDHFVNTHNVQTRQPCKRFIKGRIRVLDINRNGYHVVRFHSKGKYYTIHRLVACAFIENPNNLPVINHKNNVRTDNRVENLEWCTQSENVIHSFKTGQRSKYWGANAHLA